MLKVIHGDNTTKSRQELGEEIKNFSGEITRLDGKKIGPPEMEMILKGSSLFEEKRLIVLEEYFSLAKSKVLEELEKLILSSDNQNIIIYYPKKVAPTKLKNLRNAKISEHKLSKSLFLFLDSLFIKDKKTQIKLLHQTISEDSEFMLVTMIASRVRDLIRVLEGQTTAISPYFLQKLKVQVKNVTLDKLLKIHSELLKLDEKTKTSGSLLTLTQQLDLLVLKI